MVSVDGWPTSPHKRRGQQPTQERESKEAFHEPNTMLQGERGHFMYVF